MRTPILAMAGLILALAAACRTDLADPDLLATPNDVRSTVPADSAEFVGAEGPIAVSVVFKEPVVASEIHLQLYPPPLSIGEVTLSPTGRTATLHGVEFSDAQPAYVLVVHGKRLLRPRLVHFFPGRSTAVSGRLGGCLTADGVDPSKALVFAVDAAQVSHDEGSLLETSRSTRRMATVAQEISNCDGWYWFRFLEAERQYLVFAIVDTNGDMTYDIASDWWGYYHDRGDPTAVPVPPGVLFPPTTIDLELRPPLSALR